MDPRASRRSISFELLAINSSGDGEFDMKGISPSSAPATVTATAGTAAGDDQRQGKSKRKRRKSKSRKAQSDSNIGAMMMGENLGDIEEIMDLASTPPPQSITSSPAAVNNDEEMTTRKDETVHPRPDGSLGEFPPNKEESLKNLGSPKSSLIDVKSPGSGKGSPTMMSSSGISGMIIRREDDDSTGTAVVTSSFDTSLEALASKDINRQPSLSPKDRIMAGRAPPSGRTSPIASISSGTNSILNYVALNGGVGQKDPGFASGAASVPELRQRAIEKVGDPAALVQENGNGNGNGLDTSGKSLTKVVSFKKQKPETDPSYLGRVDVIEPPSGHRTPPLGRPPLSSHDTPHLTEWERLMAANSEYPATVDLNPLNYLRGEVQRGSSLERHSSPGIQQRRERIYNTMFHVPWRCELLIDVGFFVCLDSFLSLFTVMPARIFMFLWQRLGNCRLFQRPYAAELSDFASLVILVLGVAVLQQADISFIYHYIRGQATIKLYVVFNCLEIFDKLCQSFGGDVLQVLLNSCLAIEECPPDRLLKQWVQFCLDQSIAIVTFLVHSLVIMSQAITVSAAINSQNNALLTLLISNNFGEIKSNVFKRVAKENLHKMAYHDTVERFHIMAHLMFVLAQNFQNSEESWLANFAYNAGMVIMCEVLVDVIKHSFLAKFNEIKPGAYSDFLQALCKQGSFWNLSIEMIGLLGIWTLNTQSHEVHKTLHFNPLAPACVVLRVMIPLYATFLPKDSFWPRVMSIMMLGGGTFMVLVAAKIFIGLGLQMHAAWYLKRCKHKEGHPHAD